MPQNPGNNTVTFSFPSVANDRLNKMRTSQPSPSSFVQGGCYVTPVTVQDNITDTDYSYATDKCICQANTNTQAVQAEWLATFNNLTYRILGTRLHYDKWARLDHISFYMKTENV